MKIGLNYAFGANAHHDVGLLRNLVQSMESLGFSSLWMPEHVVGFPAEGYQSKYPYSADGKMMGKPNIAMPDPLTWMTWAAAVTAKSRWWSVQLIAVRC